VAIGRIDLGEHLLGRKVLRPLEQQVRDIDALLGRQDAMALQQTGDLVAIEGECLSHLYHRR
jgi:hypothetical protein